MAIVIPGRSGAFGVLGVDAKARRVFSSEDVHFLESIDNVLATAISRLQFESELRDTAARLRGIFETAVDGIITIDERGIVESFNPAAERIFGYAAAEIIGRNISTLMPEPYRSKHDGYLDHYRKTGEKRIIGIGREVDRPPQGRDGFPDGSGGQRRSLKVRTASLPDWCATLRSVSASNGKSSRLAITNNAASGTTCTTIFASGWPGSVSPATP